MEFIFDDFIHIYANKLSNKFDRISRELQKFMFRNYSHHYGNSKFKGLN